MTHFVVAGLVVAVGVTTSGFAQAQAQAQDAPVETTAEPAAAPVEAAPTTVPASTVAATDSSATGAVEDGARFRFGVAGGMGFFTAANEIGNAKVNCTYYGVDLRFGAQINNMFGVYAQPTIGYYTVNGGGALAAGGLLGMAAVVDATFADRFFVGAGVGYTIYNNPAGLTPLLRVGGYPLMSRSDTKARRKGLMLGMDLRFTSLEGLKTIVMPTFNVGYEAF
ncbi:MAG: hypothetical protein K0R38_2885 [Polyangiaceae bacterium]|nr:hypothetical protein [Polyangiaceae bacterium]